MKHSSNIDPLKTSKIGLCHRLGAGVALAIVASFVSQDAQASVLDDVNAAAADAQAALGEIAAIIALGVADDEELTDLYIDFNARHDAALDLVDDVQSCGRDCPYGAQILQDALDDYLDAKDDLLDFGITQGAYEDDFCCSSMDNDVCTGYPIGPLNGCAPGEIQYICNAPGSDPSGGIFCGDDWEEY